MATDTEYEPNKESDPGDPLEQLREKLDELDLAGVILALCKRLGLWESDERLGATRLQDLAGDASKWSKLAKGEKNRNLTADEIDELMRNLSRREDGEPVTPGIPVQLDEAELAVWRRALTVAAQSHQVRQNLVSKRTKGLHLIIDDEWAVLEADLRKALGDFWDKTGGILPAFLPLVDSFVKTFVERLPERREDESLLQEPGAEPHLREVEPEPEQDTEQPALERRYPFEPEMVFVPAGPFWMGTDRERLEAAVKWQDYMEDETPYHQVTLQDYWIGRYQVTNSEYRAFVEGGGYQREAYWTEAGRRWRWRNSVTQPEYWDAEGYNDSRQPVIGVSWYEAAAYCRWLSERTGHEYRLPSEAEWEKAARGTDGRIWPWGDERPDGNRCNFDRNVGKPTPVGKYSPQGDSPYGCADIAGNVWEWCATKWKDSYESYRGDDGLERDRSRILRGGAFGSSATDVHCARRGHFLPSQIFRNVGLRVVVSAPVSLPAQSKARGRLSTL